MTGSSQDMVVRLSLFSTRRCVPVLADSRTLSPHLVIGQDNKEGCATVGMHRMQIQNAAITETLQAVRNFFSSISFHDTFLSSFELGGEKKTKGAALTFVSHLPLVFLLLASLTVCPTEVNLLACFYVVFRRITKYDMSLPPLTRSSVIIPGVKLFIARLCVHALMTPLVRRPRCKLYIR
jgi:hypothetical protein